MNNKHKRKLYEFGFTSPTVDRVASGSSLASDSEPEDQEIHDLSKYLPCWPVTGRRGRRSTISIQENQESEEKSYVHELELGNKGDYHVKKFIAGERALARVDDTSSTGTSNSACVRVKVKTLLEKGKVKPVVDSDDDFDSISEDGFDTEVSNSIIQIKNHPLNSKFQEKKKHGYLRKRESDKENQKRSSGCGKGAQDVTRTTPNVLPFDLNYPPPMDTEDDVIEL